MDEKTAAPDPQSSTTPEEFVAEMRRLRAWSGLSLRQVARRAAVAGEVLPHSTLAEVLSRDRLPREDLVIAFVRACGSPPDAIEEWAAVRRYLAVAAIPGREASDDRPGETTTPVPDPVTPPKPVRLVRDQPTPVVRDRARPARGVMSMAIRLGACAAALLTLAAASTGPAGQATRPSRTSAMPELAEPKAEGAPLSVRRPFRIRAAHSKLCLSEQSATGGRVHQAVCRLAYPAMSFRPSSAGAYRIATDHPGAGPGCMGIRGATTDIGPHVYDDYCGDTGANRGGEDFLLDPVESPRRGYKMRAAHSGLCLGFLNDTVEDLAPLFQLPCAPGSVGQVFLLDPR